MLDERLEDQRLFHCGVVCAGSCLCGCMQVQVVGCGSEALVDGGHKDLGERGGDNNAPVIFRVGSISFTFIQRYDFGCSPRGRWCLNDSAVI